ncbi:MAG TPA: hypothetical protein VJ505_08085 [Holophagaceae bacterium]|nr:hypothetical protein [Holophagaceae bacterium]
MRASGTVSRPWPGWAHALLGALLFGAGLLLVMFAQQQATARKAWPLMAATLQRLATEEGARDLWARNPGIRGDYDDEAAFLAEVRAWRPRVGALPSLEPPSRSRSPWFRSASPWHIWAVAQGSGGGWVQFQVQRPGPFESPEGEGFTMVHFAPDWDALREIRGARRERRIGAHWKALRRIADQVASTEGARTLWVSEWALHSAYPTPEAFEQEAARARPMLSHLPQTPAEAYQGLALKRVRNPFMDRVDLRWKDAEGHELAVTWENGALVGFKNQG